MSRIGLRLVRQGAGLLLRVHGRSVDARTAAGTFTGLWVGIAALEPAATDDPYYADKRERVRIYMLPEAPPLEIGDEIIDDGKIWRIVALAHGPEHGLAAYDAVAPDTAR